MTVIRLKKGADPYARIPNATLQDMRLKLDELGLLCHLLSRPEDWRVSLETLRKDWGIGKDKMQNIFRGLREAGYIQGPFQKIENGRWGASEYHISPQPEKTAAVPQPENTATEPENTATEPDLPEPENTATEPDLPEPENTATRNKGQKAQKTESTKDRKIRARNGDTTPDLFGENNSIDGKLVTESPSSTPQSDWPHDYALQFRQLYPRKENMKAALEKLAKVKKSGEVTWATIIAGIGNVDRKYTPHPTTWVNGARWEDVPYWKEKEKKKPDRLDESII